MSDYGAPPPPPPPSDGEGSSDFSGLGSMPGYQGPVIGQPVARPASIATAVKLMYVGAALSLLELVSAVLMRSAIRDAVQKASDTSTKHLTSAQVDAAVSVALGLAVVSGLIGVALWLWMASANGKGRTWARVLATVFFALRVIGALTSLAQHSPVLSVVVSFVSVVLGAYIIYLLYRPESTEYYAAQSAPRV